MVDDVNDWEPVAPTDWEPVGQEAATSPLGQLGSILSQGQEVETATGEQAAHAQSDLPGIAYNTLGIPSILGGLKGAVQELGNELLPAYGEQVQKTAGDVVNETSAALTAPVNTKEGQQLQDTISYPFEKLKEGGDYLGDKTLDLTGSPAAAAAVTTAVQALPMLFLGGKGKVEGDIAPKVETALDKTAVSPDEAPPPATPAADRDERLADLRYQQKQGHLDPEETAEYAQLQHDDATQARVAQSNEPIEGMINRQGRDEKLADGDIPDTRMFLDLDDFKQAQNVPNGNLLGNAMIKEAGETIARHAADNNVTAVHLSGDEYMLHGDPEDMRATHAAAADELANKDIVARDADGNELARTQGIKMSGGEGITDEDAYNALKQSKTDRRASGDRRGTRDTPVAEPLPEDAAADSTQPVGRAAPDDSANAGTESATGPASTGADHPVLGQLDPETAANAGALLNHDDPQVRQSTRDWLDQNQGSPQRVTEALRATQFEHEQLEPKLYENEPTQTSAGVPQERGSVAAGEEGRPRSIDEGAQAGAPARQPIADRGAETDLAERPQPETGPLRGPGEQAGIAERQQAAPETGRSAGDVPGTGRSGVQPEIEPLKEVSARNAAIDAQREAMGMEPLPLAERKGFDESAAQARDMVTKDPNAAQRIVDEHSSTGRALSDPEQLVLAEHAAKLGNDHAATTAEINRARAAGDDAAGKVATLQRDTIENQARAVHKALSEGGGTANARGLAIRNAILKDDYSVGRNMARAEDHYGGLTDRLRSQARDLTDQISKHQDELERVQAQVEKERSAQPTQKQAKTQLSPDERMQQQIQRKIEKMQSDIERRLKACPL